MQKRNGNNTRPKHKLKTIILFNTKTQILEVIN